jgi:hypothetical protein
MGNGVRFKFNKITRRLFTSSDQSDEILPTSRHTPAIQHAIDNKHEILMKYQGPKDAEPRIRNVIPSEFQYGGDRGDVEHVHAYCLDNQAWRNFRTDRIKDDILGSKPRSIEPPEEGARVINGEVRTYEPEPVLDQSKLYHPSEGEYNELQKNDLHPDSFDRATIKRLRNNGATHAHLQDACKDAIPFEDYEAAREYTKDHSSAFEEAKKYRSYYVDSMTANKNYMRDNGNMFNAINPPLSPSEHLEAVTKLFNHHAAKRNRPIGDPGVHLETNDRKRAHEWIMNECAKLEPSLKPLISTQTEFNPRHIMGFHGATGYYDEPIQKLTNHYNNNIMNSKNLRSYMTNRRLLNSVIAIGSSQHSPIDYRHELYEEG